VIEAEGLTKLYGGHAAVSNVSFRVEKGEVVGFLGPNGAGKTTTMRILTCFLPPSSGSARVAGYDVMDESAAVRSRIGYLPENVPLYRDLTVRAYLDFVGTLKGMSRRDRVRRVGLVMEECGITEVLDRPIGHLSRGYRQRVGLAQALINDPEVLIMDEPTVGLDPRQIIEIRELIRNLAGKRTVMLSTHILPEASLICQRVIIINNGVLVTEGVPEDLGKSLRRSSDVELLVRGDCETVRAVLLDIPGVHGVRILDSPSSDVNRLRVESDADVRELAASRLVDGGFGLLELRTRDITLEDIFVRVVTEGERTDV
jgi:ABC-2 type transport system ATP-binding protein